jgi:hypothetical protein
MRASGRDGRLTLEQSAMITRARTLGMATALPIFLEDAELCKLTAIIVADVGQDPGRFGLAIPAGVGGYYDCPLDWFTAPQEGADFGAVYLKAVAAIPDFDTLLQSPRRNPQTAAQVCAHPVGAAVADNGAGGPKIAA